MRWFLLDYVYLFFSRVSVLRLNIQYIYIQLNCKSLPLRTVFLRDIDFEDSFLSRVIIDNFAEFDAHSLAALLLRL